MDCTLLCPMASHARARTHMQSGTSSSTASFDVVLKSLMSLQRQMVSREAVSVCMHQTVCIFAYVKHVYVLYFSLVILNFVCILFC